ncbi:MAG: ATP-dependent DNA helicase RecG, partial [Planctomycetes bacterium]|nr:ATP-dependent DNA helicase RecG [Planctomycetota bacterium]
MLDTSIQYLKGVGPERLKLFHRLGIHTVEDLLYHFPRKYLDRTRVQTIREVLSQRPTDEVTVCGQIIAVSASRSKFGKSIIGITIEDQTGIINAIWFNQPFLKRVFCKGQHIILAGKVGCYKRELQIVAPEYEILQSEGQTPVHTQGIVPCYALTDGLSQKFIRRLIKNTVPKYVSFLPDVLDAGTNLMSLPEAIKQVHFPTSQDTLDSARRRLVYEELFLFQMALALKRAQIRHSKLKYQITISAQLDSRIKARIPFTLTKAQKRVVNEIKADLLLTHPMNRLLQGDVGSGKTIVAVYAILAAIGNKLQVALMAPTEILAEQHYQTITRLLTDSKVRIALLTSGLNKQERQQKIDAIKQGQIDLVIGTHALIEKDINFARLELLIIDEQHKFGVVQRAALKAKGENPHLLVMTATPIPRTLALTAFGELDISTIDELPPGRQPVKTVLRPSSKLSDALDFIRNKIREGRQVYFVYPRIEESDTDERLILKSAKHMSKELEKVFPEYKIALLHGQLAQRTKDKIMADFRSGKTNILVSTVIIEVGIDIPNATVMVIDNAERYGLAQLHQLRGRIGRGSQKSYCLLFGDYTTPESESRLKIMEAANDGFRITEEDLRIRGPGEFL